MSQPHPMNESWAGVLARHLADAAGGTGDLQRAAERIGGALDEAQRHELAQLVRVLTEGRAALPPGALARSPHSGLLALLATAPAAAVDRARALQRFEESRQVLAPSLIGIEAQLQAAVGYFYALGGIFLLVLWVVSLKIVPQFEELFAGFGSTLPMLTRLVFTDAYGLLAIVMSLLVVGLSVGAFLFSRDLKAAFRGLRPLPTRYLRVPGVSRMAVGYQALLYTVYARVLAGSGLSAGDAHAAAAAAAGIALDRPGSLPDDDAVRELATSFVIARALGRDAEELEHQFAVGVRRLAAVFQLTLLRLANGYKAAFATVVGLLVIAIYLPIFRMGSLI